MWERKRFEHKNKQYQRLILLLILTSGCISGKCVKTLYLRLRESRKSCALDSATSVPHLAALTPVMCLLQYACCYISVMSSLKRVHLLFQRLLLSSVFMTSPSVIFHEERNQDAICNIHETIKRKSKGEKRTFHEKKIIIMWEAKFAAL